MTLTAFTLVLYGCFCTGERLSSVRRQCYACNRFEMRRADWCTVTFAVDVLPRLVLEKWPP